MPPSPTKKPVPTKLNTAKSKSASGGGGGTARTGDTTPKSTPRKGKVKTTKASKDKSSLPGISEEEVALPASTKSLEKDIPTSTYIGDKKIEYLSKELCRANHLMRRHAKLFSKNAAKRSKRSTLSGMKTGDRWDVQTGLRLLATSASLPCKSF